MFFRRLELCSAPFGGFLLPTFVDGMLRQAVQFCWMGAPKDVRRVEYVEAEIRRLIDKALWDLSQDAAGFGIQGA